jgi:AcrR family transcriptional regulator
MGTGVSRVAYGAGKDLLIEAAITVVAERGLRGLTYRAVGEEAGVNNTLVAHHFGNRDALLAAALESSTRRAIETTRLLIFSSSEEEFIQALLSTLKGESAMHSFQYEMILEANRNPAFLPAVSKSYVDYLDAMKEGLRSFGIEHDLTTVARVTFAALDGLVLQYMAGIDEQSIVEGIRRVWQNLADQRTKTEAPVSEG